MQLDQLHLFQTHDIKKDWVEAMHGGRLKQRVCSKEAGWGEQNEAAIRERASSEDMQYFKPVSRSTFVG